MHLHHAMFQRLLGRVAIVTGAASGIGLAVSKKFISEGAKLMMVDNNVQKLTEARNLLKDIVGGEIACMDGDVTNQQFANDVVKSTAEEFQTSTILVNSAGIVRNSYCVNMSEHVFDHVVDVNLKGTFLFSKAFLQHLGFKIENRKLWATSSVNVSIVNISSLAGKLGMFHQANYAASKSGVIGFSKTLCAEMGGYGVRCNAVLPGFTDTPMIKPFDEKNALKKVVNLIPMKRVARPDEVANACLFLASDESSYMNGSCLEVTGGFGA